MMSLQFDIKTKPAIFTFGLLSLISLIAHTNFTGFKPKSLMPLEEVQGIQTQNNENGSRVEVNIPYPEKYEVLGVSKTERTEQHTLKTTQSQQEVQNFYKNVLKAQNWEIENEGAVENFLNSEYKKEKARIKISASQTKNQDEKVEESTSSTTELNNTNQNDFKTIVSIEIIQRN